MVAGFESVVVVWVLAGLLNRWWLWVFESMWAGFESLVLGSFDLSLFVGFGVILECVSVYFGLVVFFSPLLWTGGGGGGCV